MFSVKMLLFAGEWQYWLVQQTWFKSVQNKQETQFSSEIIQMEEPHGTFEEVLSDVAPKKLTAKYSKAWEAFKDFAKFSGQPSKEDYRLYFDHLRTETGGKASTNWSTYTKPNGSHNRYFGSRLQQWPCLTQILKSYSANYERKVAKTFSHEEIVQFLAKSHHSHLAFWLLRKTYLAVDISWRKYLQIQDCYESPNGDFKITYHPAEQKSGVSKTFVVPKNETLPAHWYTSYVKAYLSKIKKKIETVLFQMCMKGATAKFSAASMEKHFLAATGKEFCKRPWPTGPKVIHWTHLSSIQCHPCSRPRYQLFFRPGTCIHNYFCFGH